MSITRRILDLARSNLNSLLDRVGDSDRAVDDLSDEELERELARRREERARDERREKERERGQEPESPRAASSGRENLIAQYYAQLEVPYGSDLDKVKQAYRRLMRKYHPDLHSGDAEKQKVATELAQALSRAYSELEKTLTSKRP